LCCRFFRMSHSPPTATATARNFAEIVAPEPALGLLYFGRLGLLSHPGHFVAWAPRRDITSRE
jgi:hypothetical protein